MQKICEKCGKELLSHTSYGTYVGCEHHPVTKNICNFCMHNIKDKKTKLFYCFMDSKVFYPEGCELFKPINLKFASLFSTTNGLCISADLHEIESVVNTILNIFPFIPKILYVWAPLHNAAYKIIHNGKRFIRIDNSSKKTLYEVKNELD